ncbi:MAG: DUF1566 domain-containing protein [Proteobacteria bacterium]|nr:DUF1566 domain-containing protein [Pseudomonadota bacterium]
MRRNLGIIVILLAVAFGYGCEGQTKKNAATGAAGVATTSVGVRASLDSGTSRQSMNALGTADEIVSITVDAALASDGTVLTSTALENIDGAWQGTLEMLPYDVGLVFTAQAQSTEETTIFSGTLTKTLLEDADNTIVISLTSVDDGVDPDNPVIASVSMPEKILIDADPQLITLAINHSASVAYTIEVTSGGLALAIGDTPAASISGVHDPSGSFQFFFQAPSSAGVAQLTVTLRELDTSDEIGANFYLNIVSYDPDTWTDSDATVVVGPAITDMAFVRGPNTLNVTVATDPDTGLTYEWTGTGDFADLNQTGNPIFISNFDDTKSGSITVTATDENNLQAFVARTVQAGDFPYTANEYISDMPGLYIFDETTQLMWLDNTNRINRDWADAGAYCADLNLAGYTVWRLPTRNELASMFERRDDFSRYDATGYWSADEDPTDSDYAFTISYADSDETSQKKTRRKRVRCVKN